MNKKNLFKNILPVILITVLFLSVTHAHAAAPKNEPSQVYTINWLASFPKNHSVTVGFQKGFIDKATELAKGRLVFNSRGGPVTIPAQDVGKAVQGKVVDMAIGMVGYLEPMIPGVGGLILRQISLDEERKPGGAYDFIVQMCKPKGIYHLGLPTPSKDLSFFNLFTNKKVEKPEDFKGFRMGATATTRMAAAAWGTTGVTLNIADYYTAMERGTVDGICSTVAEQFVAIGAYAVTKYAPLPGYFDNSGMVIMNLDFWNKLPADIQKVLTQAMIYSEKFNMEFNYDIKLKSLQKLKDNGVEVYDFTPSMAKWVRDSAYEATWADQLKRFPDIAPKLKELLSPPK
jgi:TRAP-type C4-dicarboxylate transport system substrate-binding protein